MHQDKKAAPLGGDLATPQTLPDAAAAYAAAGWPIVPVWDSGPRAKQPRTLHGYRDATTDAKKVRTWWRMWPTSSIGYVPPVGVIVLDLDRPGALADLEAINGAPLPDTLTVRTGRAVGGLHLYYRTKRSDLTQGVVRFADGHPVPGVDVRLGGRGYLILPPSVHAVSGLLYRWADTRPPTPLPPALEAACAPVAPRPMPLHSVGTVSADRALAGLLRTVSSASKGERNRSLFWAACRMAARDQTGLPTDWAGLSVAASEVGLPDAEIRATVASALATVAREAVPA